jgi:hypothetical protein
MTLVKISSFLCLVFIFNTIHAQTPPWTYTNTGSNHTIGIADTALNGSGIGISNGDYYGVFYDSSGTLACAGFSSFSGGFVGFGVMGDDQTTAAKDGMANSESFTIKLWKNGTNNVVDLIVSEYDSSYDSPSYITNGMTVINKLIADTSTIVNTLDNDVIGLMPKLYPNPNDGSEVYINWGEIDGFPVTLSLFDLSGKVLIKEVFQERVDKVNFSELRLIEGFYIIELSTDNASYTLRTLIH